MCRVALRVVCHCRACWSRCSLVRISFNEFPWRGCTTAASVPPSLYRVFRLGPPFFWAGVGGCLSIVACASPAWFRPGLPPAPIFQLVDTCILLILVSGECQWMSVSYAMRLPPTTTFVHDHTHKKIGLALTRRVVAPYTCWQAVSFGGMDASFFKHMEQSRKNEACNPRAAAFDRVSREGSARFFDTLPRSPTSAARFPDPTKCPSSPRACTKHLVVMC